MKRSYWRLPCRRAVFHHARRVQPWRLALLRFRSYLPCLYLLFASYADRYWRSCLLRLWHQPPVWHSLQGWHLPQVWRQLQTCHPARASRHFLISRHQNSASQPAGHPLSCWWELVRWPFSVPVRTGAPFWRVRRAILHCWRFPLAPTKEPTFLLLLCPHLAKTAESQCSSSRAFPLTNTSARIPL